MVAKHFSHRCCIRNGVAVERIGLLWDVRLTLPATSGSLSILRDPLSNFLPPAAVSKILASACPGQRGCSVKPIRIQQDANPTSTGLSCVPGCNDGVAVK